jgi:START domain
VIIKTLEDGSILECGTGVDVHELGSLYPVSKSFVRGLNQPCGSLIEPEPSVNGVKVSYLIETDLKGWFHSFIINQAIGGSYVTYFEDLLRFLKTKDSEIKSSNSS